ncbi:MAG: PGN_0703 family putative restriction endonuclease [Kosmotogaceae bacterium]
MLSGYEYIISKQIQWAKNHNIHLIGSEGKRGRHTYTLDLDQNLYEPLLEINRDQFLQGNGQEILGSQEKPAKMQALHSSSALGVNIFQYWQKRGLISEIASACGFCNRGSQYSERIVFEEKYKIDNKFVIPPNIDVVIHNNNSSKYKLFAVECKFSEAYGGRKHGGVKSAYLADQNLWADLSNLEKLAKEISPDDERYSYLHAAQLVKHILGLKTKLGNKDFRLLYLWYDVLGKEGADHRVEVKDFTEIAKSDGIKFHAMTYQELIAILDRYHRGEHFNYVKYITERYN